MWKKFIAITLTTGLLVGTAFAGDNSGDLAIIVNKASTVTSVTSAELAKIFRAEKSKGPDGVKFVISMRETGSPERTAALAGIYQMAEADYGKYFLQATFVGLVQSAPRQISSVAAMRQFVSATPGGIGYVRASDADDSVKVIQIDGHSPGDPSYPLKIK